MGLHKGDIEIGFRADEEAIRIFGSRLEAAHALRIGTHTLYGFREGVTPSGYTLQKMCFAGCDVEYILTGKRKAGGAAHENTQ